MQLKPLVVLLWGGDPVAVFGSPFHGCRVQSQVRVVTWGRCVEKHMSVQLAIGETMHKTIPQSSFS